MLHTLEYTLVPIGLAYYVIYLKGCISLLLPWLPKLPFPFEQHWLGNLGNLSSNKEIQPQWKYIVQYTTTKTGSKHPK